MAIRPKGKVPSAALLWRFGLIAMVLLALAQLGIIWLSGANETRDAVEKGERLLVKLDNGEIIGKDFSLADFQAQTDSLQAPINLPTTTPEAAPTAEAPAAATPPAAQPDSAAPPAATQTPAPEASAPVESKPVVSTPEVEDEPLRAVAPSLSSPPMVMQELIEKSDYGSLPRISGDGSKPWKSYAKPYIHKSKKPMIAIIVTGLGPSKRNNDLAIRLPENVTLSFSPYTRDLANWIGAARLSGHELLLDLPMEPANYPAVDPGPLGLLASKEQTENEPRMKRLMARTSGYMGFLTPQDEVVTSNNDLFKSLLQVVSGRGLMMVMGKPPHKSETKDIIDTSNTAYYIADTLIDEELTETAIQARLSLLEQAATDKGYAVGIAQSYPLTLEQLTEWANTLEENGYTLVPLSLIVMQRFS